MKFFLLVAISVTIVACKHTKPKLSKEAQAFNCSVSAPPGWSISDTFLLGARFIVLMTQYQNENDKFLENVTIGKDANNNIREEDYIRL